MKTGVAIFKQPDSPAESSVELYSDDGFMQIDSWTELDDTVVWFSNCNKSALAGASLQGIPYLKHSKFWVIPFQAMAKELLVEARGGDDVTRQQLIRFHDVYKKILTILSRSFDRMDIRSADRMTDILAGYLNPDVEDKKLSPSQLEIFNEAYSHTITVPGQQIKATSKVVNLSYPRSVYASHLFEQAMPFGKWTRIDRASEKYKELFQRKGKDIAPILSALDKEKPILVRTALCDKRENNNLRLFKLSNPGGQWVTLHEAVALSQYVDIKVIDGLEPERGVTAFEALDSLNMEKPTGLQLLSPCFGFSMMEIVNRLLTQVVCASDGVEYFSTQAIFLKGHDRIVCMQAAQAIIDRGFDVSSYGNNTITIAVPEEHVETLLELGYEKGLIAKLHEGDEVIANSANNKAQQNEEQHNNEVRHDPHNG